MIDLQYAKKAFENYLNDYDQKNEKIKLKIVHTYGVMECSKKITEDMKLSAEDCELAQIIGLLHDIGRFEQLINTGIKWNFFFLGKRIIISDYVIDRVIFTEVIIKGGDFIYCIFQVFFDLF